MGPTPPIVAFDHRDFDRGALLAAKGSQAVSVCLPAHDEAATVGGIVETLVRDLVREGLVDEVLVVDDRSGDGTAAVAAAAGARVVRTGSVPGAGPGTGKGEALWTSLYHARGDVVVWGDADVVGYRSHLVTGLLGPLLTRPGLAFVKGFYRRPLAGGGEGGRVTELVARPLLSTFLPHLADLRQPLAGEYAGRREVLEALPFVQGWGVDVALVADVAARLGTGALAQVDLGERRHRNRPLDELAEQAAAVLHTVLDRAAVPWDDGWSRVLVRPGAPPTPIPAGERPPLASLASYRRRTA